MVMRVIAKLAVVVGREASLVLRESLGFPLLPRAVGIGIFAEGFAFLDEAAGSGGGDEHASRGEESMKFIEQGPVQVLWKVGKDGVQIDQVEGFFGERGGRIWFY